MGQNGQSGRGIDIHYMLYDKTKEQTKGWAWWHYSLSPENAYTLIREKLQPKFGNDNPDGKGFIYFLQQKVLFQFFSRNKDEKNRDHWVLLLAWPSADLEFPELWSVFNNEVFKHIGSGKDDIPEELSVFDYDPHYCKLVHSGGTCNVERGKNSRELVEKAESMGKVNVVFYCEQSSGKAGIITEPKPGRN
jgi:hypothetical protein